MKGRRPKPTALKELAGNPGRRRAQGTEARPLKRMPQCPSWLTDDGRRLWRRLARVLFEAGLLSYVDGTALEMLCQAYGRWVAAEQALDGLVDSDHVVTSDKGGLYIHPLVLLARMHRKDFLGLCGEFGMTPASRSRIRLEAADDEDDIATLLLAVIGGENKGGGRKDEG